MPPNSSRFFRTKGRIGRALLPLLLSAALWSVCAVRAQACTHAGAIELHSPVTVTAQERAWVKSLPRLRVGVIRNTAPLVERNPQTGTYSGISIDVFCFIAQRLGLRYQLIDRTDDFSSLLEAIEHNNLDVLMPLSRQPDREATGLFTRSYFTSHYAVVSLKGHPHTLETLAKQGDFKIGVIAQSALHQDLMKVFATQHLLPLPLSAGKAAFYRALRRGEADVLVINKDMFNEDKYLNEIFDLEISQILTQYPRKYSFYFSPTPEHEKLVALFDRYLTNMDTAGAALRNEIGERRLFERYVSQQKHLFWQQALILISAISLLLLMAYIRHFRRLSMQLDASHQQVLQQQKKLLEANLQLQHMSMTDGLTGLSNRRRFDERMQLEFAQHKRSGRPLSVLMLDLDHFKQVNDQLGHATGDHYLCQVAAALMSVCRRSTDLLARYGGEEMICVLPETALSEAIQIAENIRQAVADLNLPNPGASDGILSLSIGVATQIGQHTTIQSLLAEADAHLYQAKRGGRNQVSFSA